MCAQEVPEAQPANVVVSGFSERELTEIRRGLVQRLTVAQSNIRDKRNTDDVPDWRDMYEACWSAYRKISDAIEHAKHAPIYDQHGNIIDGHHRLRLRVMTSSATCRSR